MDPNNPWLKHLEWCFGIEKQPKPTPKIIPFPILKTKRVK